MGGSHSIVINRNTSLHTYVRNTTHDGYGDDDNILDHSSSKHRYFLVYQGHRKD